MTQTGTSQKTTGRSAASAGAWTACGTALGLACAAIVGPFVSGREGTELRAYPDVVGVWTICTGETLGVRRGDVATPEQCRVMADNRIAQFGAGVLRATPRLRGHPYQLAAATSLAYNVGADAYARSTVDRMFDAGRWSAACDAFMLWDKAGGRVVQGLVNRRTAECRLCLTDLPVS